ncbi:hypothetical protein ACFC1L_26970 [Streptomyces sp. NPDC056210]|uniref:hypothetical protein n=1 Tax=Streptomyces sp. NPDC056210 TaxID=3345746 RepID=UPI0035DF36C1
MRRGGGSSRKEAILLISWSPRSTSAEQGAAQAACYAALRNQLDGVDLFIEAASQSDLEYHHLVQAARM